MEHAAQLLPALTVVLCTAGVTALLFRRLRQPVVLGYIVAGLIVGPNIPIPLVADRGVVEALSEVGVILLMFALGLEFSVRKLVKVGPSCGLAALVQSSIMVWLGYLVGQALGWTGLESLFAGALVAISSTTIIAKAFDEQGVAGTLRELVVGILIIEDLIAIFLMALLTAMSSAEGVSAAGLARSAGRLGAFLVALVAVGLLIVPRLIRAVTKLGSSETTVVVVAGLCFAIALLARGLGYSVALGAFLAGSLVAESGEAERIERLVHPIRDLFAAIFFVSVGMLIDPALIARHWGAVVVLTLVVIAGKVIAVSLGAFLAGNGVRSSIRAGMSLAQIGEFSFIIAGLGLALNATGTFLYPVAVAVSALTTFTTPWLIRASGRAASAVDRVLPRSLQTFAALYGGWIERLRAAPPEKVPRAAARRLGRLLVLDCVLLAAILIGVAVEFGDAVALLSEWTPVPDAAIRGSLGLVAALIASPFVVGIFRIARAMGLRAAQSAWPAAAQGTLDLAAAPRRSLVVALQLSVALAAVAPIAAVTQPFLPGWPVVVALGMMAVTAGIAFWRSANDLQGHVKAGAQVIVEALAARARPSTPPDAASLAGAGELLPGLGAPLPVRLERSSPVIGKTLGEVDLRGLTGAIVLVLTRGEESVSIPTASEVLRSGDVLTLVGSGDALAAAAALLVGGPGSLDPVPG